MINSLLNRNNNSTNIIIIIDSHGNVANSPESIANTFNKYFSSIASDLKQNITDGNVSFQQFLKNPVTNSMHLNMVYSKLFL